MANNNKDNPFGKSEFSDEGERGGLSVGETLKKLVSAGVSAAFMTEESVRSFVSDMKLPKETLNMIVQGAAKSKEEIVNRVSREVITILSKIDFVKEASRFMEEHKFRINAEIEIIKKEKAPAADKKDVTGSVGAAGSSTEENEITTKVGFEKRR